MSRQSRIIIPGLPHHVTQRGVRRQDVFFTPDDREYYLKWFQQTADKCEVHTLAYCLMTNHVHFIVVPSHERSLAQLFKSLHVRYACYLNAHHNWTGHAWQARFFSSTLDGEYLWTAIRYVEQNPVRASMVRHAIDYPWSSAQGHCGQKNDPMLTGNSHWTTILSEVKDWHLWLSSQESHEKVNTLRARSARDLPCASDPFLKTLEVTFNRSFRLQPRGRPQKNK